MTAQIIDLTQPLPPDFSFIGVFRESIILFCRRIAHIAAIVALVYAPLDILSILSGEGSCQKIFFNLLYQIGIIAIILLAGSASQVTPIPFWKALGMVPSKIVKFFFTNLTTNLSLLVWSLLLIIPGIVYAIRYTFVLPIVLLTERSHGSARDLSERLIRNRWWKTLGYILLSSIPLILVYIAAFSVLQLLTSAYVEVHPSVLSTVPVSENGSFLEQIAPAILICSSILFSICSCFSLFCITHLYVRLSSSTSLDARTSL